MPRIALVVNSLIINKQPCVTFDVLNLFIALRSHFVCTLYDRRFNIVKEAIFTIQICVLNAVKWT